MLHDEFPHTVRFQQLVKVSDGLGGFSSLWTDSVVLNGFLDTPSSRETFQAQQLENPYDRNLFYPYRTDITEAMRCTCEGINYELVGHPQDQGGQHEIMLVPLKVVRHGG